MRPPQQPIIKDAQGVAHFRENAIIRALLKRDGRTLTQVIADGAYSQDDREQIVQLLGYPIAQYVEQYESLVGRPIEDDLRAKATTAKAPKKSGYDPQPMQPVYETDQGTIRFRQNVIVRELVDRDGERGRVYPQFPARSDGGLNWIAMQDFSRADQEQLAQLIGYSISGYHELSYVTDESAEKASALAHVIMPGAGGCRDKGCPIHGGPITDDPDDKDVS